MTYQDPAAVRIIEATTRLIQYYGPRRVTVDEIANELHISKKTIYRHFPDKDALLWDALSGMVDPHIAEIHHIIDQGLGFRESLAAIGEVLQRLRSVITPPILRDLQFMPDLWAKVEAKRSLVIRRYGELIRRGQASGEIRPEIDAELLAAVIDESIRTIGTPRFLARHNVSIPEFAAMAMSILLQGVLTEQGKNGTDHA